MQDSRPAPGEDAATSANATGSTSAEPYRVERHAALLERPGELPGARLVLVQHQEVDVPAPLAQAGQQREQVRLGAGDPGDLLDVEDFPAGLVIVRLPLHEQPPAHGRPSAPPRPAPGGAAERPLRRAQRGELAIRSASSSGLSRPKRGSGSSSASKTGLEASTGRQLAAAS